MKRIVKYNSKKGGASTSSTAGTFIGGSTSTDFASEAAHAVKADLATKANEASHASSSATLDANSDVRLEIQDIVDELAAAANKYLSKVDDDTAQGLITFVKGLVVGSGQYGIDKDGVATFLKIITSTIQSSDFAAMEDSNTPAGWALRILDAIATGELDDLIVRRDAKVKDLTVTGAAHFFKLIIDEIKSAGGSVLLTPANGFIAENVTHHGTTGAEDERYILYWKDSDGEKTIDNQWQVGDFAVCMTANLKKGVSENTGNKVWWCKVVDSGNAGGYNFITLDWYKRAQGRTITEGGKTFTEATSSGVPEKGDNVAMLGSVATDKDGNFDYKRQSAIYLAAYDSLDLGIETPFLAFYYGIDDFCLSRHRKTHLSRLATNVVADKFTLRSDDEEYPLSVFFGDWNSETAYPKAGVVNYSGCTWTSLKDGNKGNTPSASSDWWVSNKGEDGKTVYRLEVISSAGLVYHNGKLVTVLSAHVWGPDGEVTDRCNGTFTWYDLRVSNSIGTGKTYTAQATSAVDAYHYRCIYDGDVGKEIYNVTYNSKQLQYNSKNIQF